MTQYKVDVIGEQGQDKDFDEVTEAFDHIKHLLDDGKKLEISIVPVAPIEAPAEGEGAPTTTEMTDGTDEPATDPKDADIEATDDSDGADDDDDDNDDGLTGEELDAADASEEDVESDLL